MQLFAKRLACLGEQTRHVAQVELSRPLILFRKAALGWLVVARCFRNAVGAGEPGNAALHADSLVAKFFFAGYIFKREVDIVAGGVRIYQHSVAAFASKQVVNRSVESFAFDIPESHVDGTNSGHGRRSAPPICTAIKILPDVFRLKRIAPDDAWNHVIDQITDDR